MPPEPHPQEEFMSLSTILLIVLVILLIGALPAWPYSSSWGYYPSGGLGLPSGEGSRSERGVVISVAPLRFARAATHETSVGCRPKADLRRPQSLRLRGPEGG